MPDRGDARMDEARAFDGALGPLSRKRFSDVRHVSQTGSTNADLMALGRSGAPEGIVLIADAQLAGRGRLGRTWVAPAGTALLCSVLLRPPAAVADLVTATLALAALEAVEHLGATSVGIKWPNDLVLTDERSRDGSGDGLRGDVDDGRPARKLAGILAEADWPTGTNISAGYRAPGPGERLLVIAGIGINVRTPDELPDDVVDRFVALDHLVPDPPTRDDVRDALLEAFDRWYAALLDDRAAVLDAFRRRCVTLGRDVRVDLGADDLVGRAVDVDEQGRLVVDSLDGERKVVAAGDVVHLRPRPRP
jgi:BirA family biotin operon repressor/biotin-[acetyl-CoA-carboxylase] ligase